MDNESDKESDKEFETRKQGAAYQGAFEAVIALLVAALVGYWLDGYFGTEPVLLIIGVLIGFTSFTVRLLRLGRWIEKVDSQRTRTKGNGEESNRDTR